jgi:membrane associated rhomboid family serine protease
MTRQAGSAPHSEDEIEASQGWHGAPVTHVLIAVTVGIHLAGIANPTWQAEMFEHGARVPELVATGEWHRLITSAFLHLPDGQEVVLHILFNMLWLYVLGRALEPRVGSAPFAALYVSTAIAGSAVSYLVGRGGVGASGAIYGLLGALFVEAVRHRRSPGGKETLQGWLWLLAFGLTTPLWMERIGWVTHLGGLGAGMLIGAGWADFESSRSTGRLRTGLAGTVGVLSMALVMFSPISPTSAAPEPFQDENDTEDDRAAALREELGSVAIVSGQAPPDDDIFIDPQAFGVVGDDVFVPVDGVEVRTEQIDQARRGLTAAIERWYLVDTTGTEWASMEQLDAALMEPGPDMLRWTVPYISVIERTEHGLSVYADLEGDPLTPAAQVRYLTILSDELRRAGVTRAHVRPDFP